jgi:prepilin-type processing-associated H-X9-DG protein
LFAALHAIDVTQHPMDGFDELRPPSENIRARLAELRATKLGANPDPLLLLAVNWLEANIPPDPDRVVLLHGDAGPANFLFADGKVTSMLDWELAHYGDPAADLAMICIRNLFQPFIPLKAAFAAYEKASGSPVDLDRVRYYRVYFQTQFAHAPDALNDLNAPPPPAFGSSLMYATIHMRVLSEALAEAGHIALQPVVMPEAPLGEHHRSFMLALDDLKDVIVPRLADGQAQAKAKALARLVKWWRDLERWGPGVEAQERAELSAALGVAAPSAKEGRALLTQRIAAGTIDTAVALQLCHARTVRAGLVFADAMGALAESRFPPLD